MSRWRPQLPTLAGSVALLLAAWLAWVATPRWRADGQQALHMLRQTPRPAAAPASTADLQLVLALPTADTAATRIQALVAAAQAHGIRLDSLRQGAPLRLGQGAGQLAAERVPLQLSGSAGYGAWRQFVADALQQDDALLLDDLRLHRAKATEPVLAGTLQWALLQRLPGTAGPAATPAAPSLPARPADWPAAPPAALAAWQPAAPSAPLAMATAPISDPVVPPAPPFPYRWIGELDDGGPPQALLAGPQRSVAVRVGDTLDGRWRLLRGPQGQLLAQALPDGAPVAVPGAPAAAQP